MSWILSEELALKQLLSGITVTDEKNAVRPVGVWFGLPDPEIRPVTFPYFTIDLIQISQSLERTRSGPFVFEDSYVPDLPAGAASVRLPTDNNTALVSHLPPTPYDLDYTVTTWARIPQHDRQILAKLLSGPLPMQFGQVSIPVDQTVRRLDLTGLAQAHMLDGAGKRIFRNVFSVRISSELFAWQLAAIGTVWNSAIIQGGPDIGVMTPITATVTPTTPVSPIIFSP